MGKAGTLVSDLHDRARNRLLTLAGHFAHPVRIDAVEEIGQGFYLLKVRHSSGQPDETQVTGEELERALAEQGPVAALSHARDMFRWVEGQRIKLSFAHDPLFAVSMSGVRGLPHQIEAVYRHMLPQPRLRFVLADDPGVGKTIMAGLLLKELKLRGVVDRCLILAPSPLTPQWQDEMSEKFDEQFEIVGSDQVRHQLGRSAWDRYPMVITSIDFAKRDDVRDDLLRAEWDLVVIDEAHKCAAYTGSDDGAVKTKRYALAESLAGRTERLLLMTATPHSGDEDRFRWFLGLLDLDQFSSIDLVKRQIAQDGNPYFLRRQKEDLVNEQCHELFVPRHVKTQPFQLSAAEKELYDAVTRYVNEYLGAPVGGGRGSAVALARTVLQRRLASSLGAIRSSLAKRAERLAERADELERMTPAQRRRRLAELGSMPKVSGDVEGDPEIGYDDVDERTEDELATAVSGAQEIEALRAEVAELRQLVSQADRVRDMGTERKLVALQDCLTKSELQELENGRGKLLIFTEHRDTLEYLERHLRDWGYTVCTIHGGHPPIERKKIQQEFRTRKQICIATEAAGEGINLQFCHLMVNYDLPWNPVRLEQRMGRVHRIGQREDCYIFNFCATNTVEGQLVERLHVKLETMKSALQGRVYDVIGDLLTLNGIDFERLVKDTLLNPSRIEAAKQQINRMTAEKYQEYQQATGIALAKRHVDMEWVRDRDFLSEERRLMPEYVEAYFLDAAEQVRLRVERRADTLLRIEHVPLALRSEDLTSVSRLGRPDADYRKLTFRKEQRDRPEHGDAILCSPGHPLFAAVAEALDRELEARGVPQSSAVFIDPATTEPYSLHLFSYEVVGEDQRGNAEPAYAEVVAVVEEQDQLNRAPADILHTFTPSSRRDVTPPDPDVIKAAENWVRVNVQMPRTNTERTARLEQAELRRAYLEEAMAAQRRRLEDRWSEYDARVAKGDEAYRLLRDTTLNRLKELEHRQKAKLENVLPFRIDYINTIKVGVDVKDKKVPAIDTERALLDSRRIAEVVGYTLEHFDQKTRRTFGYMYTLISNVSDVAAGRNRVEEVTTPSRVKGFNALFATASIEAAKRYYAEFAKQQQVLPPDRRLKVGLIYSYAPNEAEADGFLDEEGFETEELDKTSRDFLEAAIGDYNAMFGTTYDTSSDKFQNYYKDLSLRLKNRQIDLVIVCNMFLTGFDATTLNTLFVDKRLVNHGLLQAYSRTNRILNSVKTYGNIVSFRDLEHETNDAIALLGNKDAKGIVLLKPYGDYYAEYGEKVAALLEWFPLGASIQGESAQKAFIALFGQILRLQNILVSFDDFVGNEILTERQSQDYRSVYLDLYAEYRRDKDADKEQINDDIVFEIELIKQVEINVDYILMLVQKYRDARGDGEDVEIRANISRAIDSSPSLRNKKDLIEDFVDSVSATGEIDDEWQAYVAERREAELNEIIEAENLRPRETRAFIDAAFRDGPIQTTGTAITKVLPPTSRFSASGGHGEKKQRVLTKLSVFFGRFFGLSTSGGSDG